jgi:uncharacterized protein (DUF1697 family)
MSELCRFAAAIGLEEPRTLLQSGNLVFASRKRPTGALEQLLEEKAREQLGLQTDFLVRNEDEWGQIVRANPFAEAAIRDPSHLVVMFFKAPLRRGSVDELTRLNTGRETMYAAGRELYTVFPDGLGRSKLTPLMTESRLGSRGTARNWNTVLKLLAALEGTRARDSR